MLSCLEARREAFPKDAFLLRTGDTAESVGIVLSGSIMIIQEDIWGNRNILSKAGQGQVYAAFACAPGAVLNVSVIAETPVTVMLLNIRRVLTVCSPPVSITTASYEICWRSLPRKICFRMKNSPTWDNGQQGAS